jgi:transcriptional regulator of nitric oxide reductase
MLVGIDMKGIVTAIKLVEHKESILLSACRGTLG